MRPILNILMLISEITQSHQICFAQFGPQRRDLCCFIVVTIIRSILFFDSVKLLFVDIWACFLRVFSHEVAYRLLADWKLFLACKEVLARAFSNKTPLLPFLDFILQILKVQK